MELTSLVTLVGLICNYRQEVALRKSDEREPFIDWLTNHRHQEIVALLRENMALSRDIQNLIEDAKGSVDESLASISGQLAMLISRIDGFRSIQQALAPVVSCQTKPLSCSPFSLGLVLSQCRSFRQ